jgi:integrase
MNKTTQPIKDRRRINEILTYLRGKSERNYMIAKIQLNTARRISDIVNLKVSDFLTPAG